jgi:hypothetical protein
MDQQLASIQRTESRWYRIAEPDHAQQLID